MPSVSVDGVIADPPYGAQIVEWDKNIPPQFALDECLRISRGPVVWFGSCYPEHMAKFFLYRPIPERILIWHVNFSMSKAARNSMFYKWQPIYCWRLPEKTNLNYDVLACPTEGKSSGFYHPGKKPVRIMRRLVAGFNCSSILDPYMGSGTTGVACKELGIDFVGIEIDTKYFQIAKNRIAKVPPSFTWIQPDRNPIHQQNLWAAEELNYLDKTYTTGIYRQKRQK